VENIDDLILLMAFLDGGAIAMKKSPVLVFFISGLAVISLACWLVMFLAGHDVWNFAGKPDFWNLKGPPYTDLRAFAFAFYAQFVVLLALAVFIVRQVSSARKGSKSISQ